jgi:ribosomal protein L35
MPKLKTRKAIVKRFKISKNKKITHRACGQDHFNARESSRTTMQKRRDKNLHQSQKKIVKKSLPYL